MVAQLITGQNGETTMAELLRPEPLLEPCISIASWQQSPPELS
jgi:hypothetical protein